MIVKNEAHVIIETLGSVARHISSWVIVDTGSTDGTQNLIREQMARLGIPGELHERPWRNFGHNRTEALSLAQGHGDYIWVVDADDLVVGTPDFTQLSADVYHMRLAEDTFTYWRPQLFRDGVQIRYQGVVHETAIGDPDCVVERLEGDYVIESRRLGSRSRDPQKYARDRDLLLAEVERNPEDSRSVFYLAQSYFDLDDFANARKWYKRRVELGGWDEEVYYSKFRLAESMARLDVPWLVVQDAYLRAWEFRPTRAEAVYAIARRYREHERYLPAYAFAQRAAQIPFPENDLLFVLADIYAWRAVDEQAVSASQLGKHEESFGLCRQIMALPEVPDHERQRIAANRDLSVPEMLTAAAAYPDALVQRQTAATPGEPKVVVSLVAGPDRAATEQSINSFLNCFLDAAMYVERVLVLDKLDALDGGLSGADRAALAERYGFLEFVDSQPGDTPAAQLARLRTQIPGQLWLHLGSDWQFFAPDILITRLVAVLVAEPHVFQVGINFDDAAKLTGVCAAESAVRRAQHTGRYVLTDTVAKGPAMFHLGRLNQACGGQDSGPESIAELGRLAVAAGLKTASLDEVLCIAPVRSAPKSKDLNSPELREKMRNPGLPKVVIFGVTSMDQLPSAEQLRSHPAPSFEADTFDFSLFEDDQDLARILKDVDPQCIVTIGDIDSFPNLMATPYYIRNKWIHKDRASDLRGIDMLHCFLGGVLPEYDDRKDVPKVSVFTPVYNTGRERLLRTWQSLLRQSYRDWEWVIADDHSTDQGTLEALEEIGADYRVSVHRLEKPSGNIGVLKGHLCSVASGDIFLELDHDDVLTPETVSWIVEAFAAYPECGVAYTDWSEQFEGTLEFGDYGEDYAFGYGKARWEWHPENYATFEKVETRYLVQNSVNINAKTIRHIVGVPNHARAWTRAAYQKAGGYSRLHVADDYELLVRLFLTTKFVHIPKLGYVQSYNSQSIGNTQDARRKEIQRIVRFVAQHYERRIHARLLELGVNDYIWTPTGLDWNRPRPEPESHCTMVLQG